MKKTFLIPQLIFIVIFLAGCSDSGSAEQPEQATDDIEVTDSNSDDVKELDSDSTMPGGDARDTSHGNSDGQDSQSAENADTAQDDDTDTRGPQGRDTDKGSDEPSGTDAASTDDNDPDDSDEDTETTSTPDNQDDSDDSTKNDTDVDPDACVYTCRAENWCTNNDGVIHEDLNCDEATQVCCEVEDDSDTRGRGDGGDDDTDSSINSCTYECHPNSWCTGNNATIYEDLTCSGKQVCCAVQE
ncbi:MAG: hypothetical protein JXR76_06550 [Deltaproteobacteria bacterium]|nr:hypothetical protein [Deltaproteobacteria bacterium]